jgi:hypothetical protein
MQITCSNESVMALLGAQRRRDGQIAEGVYIEAHSNANMGDLIYLFVGQREIGPMLQYTAHGEDLYDGYARRNFADGAWTTLYSNANYGRRYAAGGTWTGHHKSLHARIARECKREHDLVYPLVACGDEFIALPPECGIEPDVIATEMDCSVGWPIFTGSAREALEMRLIPDEINSAIMRTQARMHLMASDTSERRDVLADVLSAFHL